MSTDSTSFKIVSPELGPEENARVIDDILDGNQEPRFRFLILDLIGMGDQPHPSVDSLNECLEYIHFVEGHWRERVTRRRESAGLGWVDLQQRECRMVAAAVNTPTVDWHPKLLTTFQHLNRELSRLEVPVREFDRSDASFPMRFNQFKSELFQFASGVVENSPRPPDDEYAAFDETLRKFLEPEAFYNAGFNPAEVEAIGRIHSHMSEFLRSLNSGIGRKSETGETI